VERKAEAALKSSSKSETVRSEEASDLEERAPGSQSDTVVDTEKMPDSQEPNLLKVGAKGASRPEEQPRKESSCERQPLYGCIVRLSRPSSLSRSIPPLDEVTIRPFSFWRPFGVEVELVEEMPTLALGEGGEFGREVECLVPGEGGHEVGLVTLGDGTSKQEEKSSNVEPGTN